MDGPDRLRDWLVGIGQRSDLGVLSLSVGEPEGKLRLPVICVWFRARVAEV